jgi:hypothetical protein
MKNSSHHAKHFYSVAIVLSLLATTLLLELTQSAKAALVIEPANPVVEVGGQITLSVSGADENSEVTWNPTKGQIQGIGNQVIYLAPTEEGVDVVIVLDDVGNAEMIKIMVVNELPDSPLPSLSRKAAILIHPNGKGSGYNQEQTTDFLATYAYQTLLARNYRDDEIYLLSHKPDLFDSENLVDAPVTLADFQNGKTSRDLNVADIQATFNWAKSIGELDQPLVVIFVGNGELHQLFLDAKGQEVLTALEFGEILDDYQKTTHNQIIVIIEAGYSGSLIATLAATNRLIITSTDSDNHASHNDNGRASFLTLYFDQLRQNQNFWDAWQAVTKMIAAYPSPFSQQRPQLNDFLKGSMAKELCLNNCQQGLPGPVLTIQTLGGIVAPEQTLDLSVTTQDEAVQGIWVSVTTPQMISQLNAQGYSRQPPITLRLREEPIGSGQWHTSYDGFTTHGNYILSFRAQSSHDRPQKCFIKGNDEPRCFITVTVEQGATITYASLNDNILHIPAVAVPDGHGGEVFYQAQLIQRADLRFELNSLIPIDDNISGIGGIGIANYNPKTMTVSIPWWDTVHEVSRLAELQLITPITEPLLFELKY